MTIIRLLLCSLLWPLAHLARGVLAVAGVPVVGWLARRAVQTSERIVVGPLTARLYAREGDQMVLHSERGEQVRAVALVRQLYGGNAEVTLLDPRYVVSVQSKADPERRVLTWAPGWARLWGNLDEGVNPVAEPTNASGRRWWARSRGWSWARQAFSWSALRNPVSNLRFSRLGVEIDPARVERVGNSTNPGKDWRTWPRVEPFSTSEEMLSTLRPETPEDAVYLTRLWLRTKRGRPRAFWIWARQGWKSGLWIVLARSGRTIQLGWRVYVWDPARDRPIDRYFGPKLQLWRKP